MSIVHADPFAEFERFFTPILRTASHATGGLKSSSSLDLKEIDNGYVAQLNLPGLKKEDIDISIDNGVLSVKANQKEETSHSDDQGWHIRERYCGHIARSWAVPRGLTHDDIKASLNDGVLSLKYPRKDTEGAKKVTIH